MGRDGPPGRDGLSCFTINDKISLDLLSSFGGRFWLPVVCKAVAVISRLLRMIHWFEKIYTSWSDFTMSWKCCLLRMHIYNYFAIGCLNWTTVEVLKKQHEPLIGCVHKGGSSLNLNINVWGEMDHPAWGEMDHCPSRLKGVHLAPYIYSC